MNSEKLAEATRMFLSDPEEFLRSSEHRGRVFAVLASLRAEDVEVDRALIALARAVQAVPHCWIFAQAYLSSIASPTRLLLQSDEEETEGEPKCKKIRNNTYQRHEDLLFACWTLVLTHRHFRHLWPWTDLLRADKSGWSHECIWLTSEVVGVALGLSEKKRETLSALTSERYKELTCKMHLRRQNQRQTATERGNHSVPPVAVSGLVCVESGVALPVVSGHSEQESTFVRLSSRQSQLRQLTLCVSAGRPVMLTGPPGTGKTAVIDHLRSVTGRRDFVNFHQAQISDETDARTFLGTYTCATPEQFVWERGLLTRALEEGHWLLVEDADKAPPDVLSLLLSFVETSSVVISALGKTCRPRPGFQLILTGQRSLNCPSLQTVAFPTYTKVEVAEIVAAQYPTLRGAVIHLAQAVERFNQVGNRERNLSLHDIIRWCQRCPEGEEVVDRTRLFQEAIAIFCFPLISTAERVRRTEMLGQIFQVDDDMARSFLNERKPEVIFEGSSVKVGSARLELPSVGDVVVDASYCLNRQTSNLLEFLITSVRESQPVLLVGETGVGKTATVQYLSSLMGKKLHVLNISDCSESSDLFGSFRPVDNSMEYYSQLVKSFLELCEKDFSHRTPLNAKLSMVLEKELHLRHWSKVVTVVELASDKAFSNTNSEAWFELRAKAREIKRMSEKKLLGNLFSFVEGSLTEAVKRGDWVLLDEVNLAGAESLLALGDLFKDSGFLRLHDGVGTLVQRHADFRLFACMNPSTDVGKKELPESFRKNFVEFFLTEPRPLSKDLELVVQKYLSPVGANDDVVSKVVKFYSAVKEASATTLNDGAGRKPCYSLRSLCRALRIAAKTCGEVGLEAALIEATCMCFLTELDRISYVEVVKLIFKSFHCAKAMKKFPARPNAVCVEGYWISCGKSEINLQDDYILTRTVRQNLRDIVRVVALSKFPLLLQGETSSGKTSLVRYLALASGHTLLRINNHEHTDLQEYVGSYGADASCRFAFKEGALATAMRKGYWILLDELNLAPTEILEALNRVLDDNRELYIPETGARIRAHSDFRVFATQNPVGLYGGRKVLSRAFRNRFVELHFDELPPKELETILQKRNCVPPSLSRNMVRVMTQLQLRRRESQAFQGKRGFITLRDLFRWASRYASFTQTNKFYDWDAHMAEEGFLALSSRCRNEGEVEVIREIIGKVFKRTISPNIFSLEQPGLALKAEMEAIKAMDLDLALTAETVRMLALLLHSFRHKEPVLLVGETGVGKTSACAAVAQHLQRKLHSLSCHLNTDATDFLGSLRPVRDGAKLFEWHDGPLVTAMVKGEALLVDEISLADDSVLERMNSVLENERTLVVPERPTSSGELETVVAKEEFLLCATMNPGGDFGKKELSPALRNRFTEIWCSSDYSDEDSEKILTYILGNVISDKSAKGIHALVSSVRNHMTVTYRDLRTWATFIKEAVKNRRLPEACAIVHGACLALFDGLQTLNSFASNQKRQDFKLSCRQFLSKALGHETCNCLVWVDAEEAPNINVTESGLSVGSFHLPRTNRDAMKSQFLFNTATAATNLLRLVRSLPVGKPVLLEGPPGAGKSATVEALAQATGNDFVRINLSEQTDVADLFGCEMPTATSIGHFAWQDGPFLAALKSGHWILLDELNLANQAILEGLNACLDHRGEVYIPELDKSFRLNRANTRIFATQNPYREGSGRKGLPKSFLNRFVKVFVNEPEKDDISKICLHRFSSLQKEKVTKFVSTYEILSKRVTELRPDGGPWTFNLRDLLKWCEAVSEFNDDYTINRMGRLLFIERFRTPKDRENLLETLSECVPFDASASLGISMDEESVTIGGASLTRETESDTVGDDLVVLSEQFSILESLMFCVRLKWIPLLVGSSCAGKTRAVQTLARLAGKKLHVMTLSSVSDTSDLLGSFEQCNKSVRTTNARAAITKVADRCLRDLQDPQLILELLLLRKEDMLTGLCSHLMDQFQLSEEEVRELKVAQEDLTLKEQFTFDWVDSPLVEAVAKGHWVLIDNANFCSPSVLDRLNGLFESGGELAISEGGGLRCIRPHKDFRVFLTMNPKNGELSKAMRNRCVEIFLERQPDSCLPKLLSAKLADEERFELAKYLTHLDATTLDSSTSSNLGELISWLVSSGLAPAPALKEASLMIEVSFVEDKKWDETDFLLRPLMMSELLSHPVTSLAAHQLHLLRNYVGLEESTGKKRQAIKSFIRFSTSQDLDTRLALLQDEFTNRTRKDLLDILKLRDPKSPLDDAFVKGARKQVSEVPFPSCRDWLAVDGLLLPAVVIRAHSTHLSDLLQQAEQFASDLSEILLGWLKDVKNEILQDGWMLGWRIFCAAAAMRDLFVDERDKKKAEVKMAMLERAAMDLLNQLLGQDRLKSSPLRQLTVSKGVPRTIRWRVDSGGGGCDLYDFENTADECRTYKMFVAFAASVDLLDSKSFEHLRESLYKQLAFVKGFLDTSFDLQLVTKNNLKSLVLEDQLMSNFNLISATSEKPNFLTSPLHPLTLKVKLLGARKKELPNLVAANSFRLHKMAEDKWSDLFGLNQALVFEVLESIQPGRLRCTLGEVADDVLVAVETLSTLSRNYDFWQNSEDYDGLLELSLGLKSFKAALSAMSFTLKANPDCPEEMLQELEAIFTDEGREALIVSNARKALQNAKHGEVLMTTGFILIELMLTFVLDKRCLLEAEIFRLNEEIISAKTTMISDHLCHTLHVGEMVAHHPIHHRLRSLVESNTSEISRLEKLLPVRIEDTQELVQEIRQVADGFLSKTFIENLDSQAKFLSWKSSLLNYARDMEVKFTSFPDVLAVLNCAIANIVCGLHTLRKQERAESIKDLDALRSVIELSHKSLPAPYQGHIWSEESGIVYGPESLLRRNDLSALSRLEFTIQVLERKKKTLSVETGEAITKWMLDLTRNASSLVSILERVLAPAIIKSFRFSLQHLLVTSREKHRLLALAPIVHSVKVRTEELLTDHWPENPNLTEIVVKANQLLEHSLWDQESSFQLALEGMAKCVGAWNKNAPTRYSISFAKATNFLSSWYQKEIRQLVEVREVVDKGWEEKLSSFAGTFTILCEEMAASGKLEWLFTLSANFLLAGTTGDFKMRLSALEQVKNLFIGVDESAAQVISAVLSLSTWCESAVMEKLEAGRKATNKKAISAAKILSLVREEKTFVKIRRERAKLARDCNNVIITPLPQLQWHKIEPPKILLEPIEEVEVEKVEDVIEFTSSDGTLLGNSYSMAQTAKSFMDTAAKVLSQDHLGDLNQVGELVKTLQMLNDSSKKSEVYTARKSVDALFKTLKELGLSYRLGNMHKLDCASVVSSFGGEPATEAVSGCLALTECLVEALRRNADRLQPQFEERALGFARHGVLIVLETSCYFRSLKKSIAQLTADMSCLRELHWLHRQGISRQSFDAVANRGERLHQLLTPFELKTEIRMKLDEIQKFRAEARRRIIEKQSLESLIKTTFDAAFFICESYSALKPILNEDTMIVYSVACKLKQELQGLQNSTLPSSAVSKEFSGFCKRFLTRCLNATKDCKKYLLEKEKQDTGFFSSEKLWNIVQIMDSGKRAGDLSFLLHQAKTSKAQMDFLAAGLPILNVYANFCHMVCSWSSQVVWHNTSFLCSTVKAFALFSAVAPASKDDDQDVEGDEQQGDAKESSGVGLGEGEGGKATTEGVDSEDLFEQNVEQEQEQNGDRGDDKAKSDRADDFVDYSDQMPEDSHMSDGASEDEDDDNGDNEDLSDEEGEAANQDEAGNKDEVLNADEWKQQEEKEEDKEENNESSDQKTDFQNQSEQKDQPEEESNDLVERPEEEIEEKRQRQPDAEEDGDIEDQRDDGEVNPHDEPEIEDLDLPDDEGCLDEGENGSDQSEDMELDEQVERLQDFEEEEVPGKNEENENQTCPEADMHDDDKKSSDNQVSSDAGAAAGGGEEKSGKEKEEEVKEDDNKDVAEIDGEEEAAEEVDPQKGLIDSAGRVEEKDEKMECDLLAEEELKIVPAENSTDVEQSDMYAHMDDAKKDDENTKPTLDEVPFESLEKLKSEFQDSIANSSEKSREEMQHRLEQPLGMRKLTDFEDAVTNLVSRGLDNTFDVGKEYEVNDDNEEELTKQSDMKMVDGAGNVLGSSDDRWRELCSETSSLASSLCEQLRLIIEPTKASRFCGDFRSGKRLNMRRVVAYIASEFRRDKIWLRRTRPARRECRIAVAVDDSSSMSDGRVQKVTFCSLATVCQAFSLLEVGALGVVRFGENAEIAMPLRDRVSDSDGAAIVNAFTFGQSVTRYAEMLTLCRRLLNDGGSGGSNRHPSSKLLLILSDGKGVLNEGKRKVQAAVRASRLEGIFIVFVIVEAGEGAEAIRESVLDVRMPIYDEAGNVLRFDPYMEHFPFPYYILLRDFQRLPQVLSDALRQWFELVNSGL